MAEQQLTIAWLLTDESITAFNLFHVKDQYSILPKMIQ
jgi:hypothetical protein